MSKMGVLVCGILVLLGMTCVGFAQEPVESYTVGGMFDPYSGPTPPGMRFGDVAQAITVETGAIEGYAEGGCPNCGFGVRNVPCDPAWSGPCLDWKSIGWYSSFHDKNHGGCGCRCRAPCGSCCY